MKRIYIILLAIFSLCQANAQRDYTTGNFRQKVADDGYMASPSDMADGIDFHEKPVADSLTLNIPTLTDRGTMAPINMYPYYYWGYNSWDLHPGMNVNIGMSVFAQFGSGAYHGAGFAQNISMMYAVPLNKRLSLAIGGYFDNMNWGSYTQRNVGVNAVLGYQFDEHWSAYAYLQKSLVSNNSSRYIYGYGMNNWGDLGDRIGAAVRYAPNKNFSFEVSVEANRRPTSNY